MRQYIAVGAMIFTLVSGYVTVASAASVKRGITYDLRAPNARYTTVSENASSKCATPALKKVHAGYLARVEKDGAPWKLTYEDASKRSDVLAVALVRYHDALENAWNAIEKPECGQKLFGVQLAKHAYEKQVSAARNAFLSAARAYRGKKLTAVYK